MRNTICLLALLPALAACQQKKDGDSNWSEARTEAETAATRFLHAAREACGKGDFQAARIALDSIRVRHPLALDARETGILLLDSINLLDAGRELEHTDSLMAAGEATDSMQARFEDLAYQVKFYRRKLSHDRSKRKKH